MIAVERFNSVALWTLVKREMIRSLKIINQVIWPPIISTLLYVFVFGLALGSSIKSVQGVSYAQFLIPGLIMLQTIDSSYGESSSSIFQGRFMNSIQEMLIAPMSALEIVLGYVLGSLVRAYLIAVLITLLGAMLVHTWPQNWGLYFLVITLVSILFSSLGLDLRPHGREVRSSRRAQHLCNHAAHLRRRRLHLGADAAAGASRARAF